MKTEDNKKQEELTDEQTTCREVESLQVTINLISRSEGTTPAKGQVPGIL